MNHESAPSIPIKDEEEESSADLIGLEAEFRKLKKMIDDIEKKCYWTIFGRSRTSLH